MHKQIQVYPGEFLEDKQIIADTIKKIDSLILERNFPSEKEKILGETVGLLREKKDLETEKYLQMEWMLLNNVCGSDKWTHILDQGLIGEKPPFWNYEPQTVQYFKERLTGEPPKIARARIEYYLWTATKDFEYAKIAIEDFEASLEEHSRSNEFDYFETGLNCGKLSLAMMSKFKQNDRISSTFIPKLMALIRDAKNDYLLRGLVELGVNSLARIHKPDSAEETKEAAALVDICKARIRELIEIQSCHIAMIWIEILESYAKETQNAKLLSEMQNQHLNLIIADGDRHPSPLLKTTFYQAALQYAQESGIHDKAMEQKLKELLAQNMKASVSCFKTVQTSIEIPFKEIDSELEHAGQGKNQRERIFYLAETLIPNEATVRRLVEIKFTGLMSVLSVVVQTKDHISKPLTDEERITYETLNSVAFALQTNQILISRAFEKYALSLSDFEKIIDEVDLSADIKEFLKRGLERHFAEEYVSSLHILCPQLEEVLRQMIESEGGETLTIDQRTKSINQDLLAALIRDDITKRKLGEMVCKIFEAYYANPNHYNLRNKIAHGLAEKKDFSRMNSIITIFLLVYILSRMKPPQPPNQSNSQTAS